MNEHDAETMLGGDFPPFAVAGSQSTAERGKTSAWMAVSSQEACKKGSGSYACSSRKVSLQFRIWTRLGESIGSGKGQSAVELRT